MPVFSVKTMRELKIQSMNNNKPNDEKMPLAIKIIFSVFFILFLGLCVTLIYVTIEREFGTAPQTNTKSNTVQIPETWRDSSLFNISNFTWIRNNASICNGDQSKNGDLPENLLLIMVNSARENFPARSAIRTAVQKMASTIKGGTGNWAIRLVFLLGTAVQPHDAMEFGALQVEEALLNEENVINGDLITGNFIDTFENLTYKTMMGLKWALNFCLNAGVIIKMDDNAFFNIPMFVEWRNGEARDLVGSTTEMPILYCIPERDKKPLRVPNNQSYGQMKWLVSESEWSDNTFPSHCQGLLYGMTINLAKKMYHESGFVKYFRLEDVFFTGVVLEKVKQKYGLMYQRNIKTDLKTEQTILTVCEKTLMRQTVSQNIGLVVRLERDSSMEKHMLCLARDVPEMVS